MRHLAGSCAALAVLCLANASAAQTVKGPVHWKFLDHPTAKLQAASYAPTPVAPSVSSYPVAIPGANLAGLDEGWSDSQLGSIGCLVGGTVGTAVSIAVGGPNVINLIAGGIVSAASPAALYTALVGVVFASFCAIGESATPTVVMAYREYYGTSAVARPTVPPTVPQQPPYMSRLPQPTQGYPGVRPIRFTPTR